MRLLLTMSQWGLVLCGFVGFFPVVSFAEERDAAYFEMLFERKYPSFQVQAVKSAPIKGWKEVVGKGPNGARVVYMSGDGRYILAGALFDVEGNINLTGQSLVTLSRSVSSDFDLEAVSFSLDPADGAPPDLNKRILYFVDPDCPYCQKWEAESRKVLAAGYAISVLLYPNSKIHPEAEGKSHAVWCAEDQVKAFQQIMRGKTIAPAEQCHAPLEEVRAFGQRVRVTGTPFFVLPDGRRLGGFHEAEELLQLLHQLQKEKPVG